MGNSRFPSPQNERVSILRSPNFIRIPDKMSGALKRFLPMFDRVLIQRAEAATKSKGGILIPEKAQQKMKEGTVVAAGPGGRNEQTGATIPMVVKVGDTVLLMCHPVMKCESHAPNVESCPMPPPCSFSLSG